MDGDAGNIHAGDSGNGVKNALGAAERPLPAAVNCSQITRGPQEYFLRPFVCDCPQVLLPVRTPVYRKERNVCKGNLSRVSLAC